MSDYITKEKKDQVLQYITNDTFQEMLLFCSLKESDRKAIAIQYIVPHVIEQIKQGSDSEYLLFDIKGYKKIRRLLTDKE